MKIKNIPALSARLKYIREELDISQAELARLAGATQQAIQQAENGKARNPRYLVRLAQKTGVPHEWLALNVMSSANEKASKSSLSFQENEILDSFRSMSKKEQKLMLELMKSRTGK